MVGAVPRLLCQTSEVETGLTEKGHSKEKASTTLYSAQRMKMANGTVVPDRTIEAYKGSRGTDPHSLHFGASRSYNK